MSDFDDEPTDETVEEARGRGRSNAVDDDWDDDWDDEDDRGGRRDLTLVYAVVAAAIVIVLAIVLTRPKDDNDANANSNGSTNTEQPAAIVKNWQGAVGDAVGENGADAKARVSKAPGVYIWTDFQGWHVRSSLDKDVTVTVTAPQVRKKATDDYDDKDEKGDAPFSTEAVVTLASGDDAGAGFDLGGSESATFAVTVDGANLPAAQIFLGGADGVADASPVQFTKS